MLGGRGGMNSRKMQQMMNQMGIEMEELEGVEEVVIRTSSKELRIEEPDVTRMEAKGQTTFQVVGEPIESAAVSEEDVEIVASRAEVDEDEARRALEAADGDLAQAISDLS